MRRLVIAAAVGAAVVGTAVPSLASQTSTPKATLPVGASVSTNGGVFVGTTIFGQPGLAARVANGAACVGFSYEIPVCAALPPVTIQPPPAPAAAPRQSLPSGGVVGTAVPSLARSSSPRTAPPVGITDSNGKVCVWISEQVPQCVDTTPITDALPAEWSVGPVHVFVSTANGGVAVGTALGSQPLVGAWVGNGQACVGFSLEVPVCVPLTSTGPAAAPRQSLPVVIYHDDTRTAVGVENVGVVIYSDGRICPVVSTQAWRCIPAQLG